MKELFEQFERQAIDANYPISFSKTDGNTKYFYTQTQSMFDGWLLHYRHSNGVANNVIYKQHVEKMRQKPKQNTEVKHSQSKNAWNVVGTDLGGKYKIARVPYEVVEGSDILTTQNKAEALEHAMFISWCFCNPDKVQY